MVKVMPAYIPDRGDIVWLDFNPALGHEQKGQRPALVLSPKDYNSRSSLLLACPITTKIKGYPFEVRVQAATIDGVILADQVKTLDWQVRKIRRATKAPAVALNETTQKLRLLLQ